MKSIYLTLAFLIIFIINSFSQTQTIYVKPIQTDSNYSALEDSNYIVRNNTIHNNKLVLFMGGGGSSPNNYWAFCQLSAILGFDAISLCYNSHYGVAPLANSTDSLVFDKIRQETCFGTPVSDSIDVDTLHSIYMRFLKLIQYLCINYPSQNWNQYLTSSNALDWTKIIVAGHSFGSGHAAYLAKFFPIERVLMFSGPNDYSTYYNRPALWFYTPGITDTSKHFFYLNLLDEIVPFLHQLLNNAALGILVNDDTTFIDSSSPPVFIFALLIYYPATRNKRALS